MSGNFLNVDLEVRASFDLEPLRLAMGERISLMFCGQTEPGRFLLSVETAELYEFDASADQRTIALCKVIEDLSGEALESWKSANDRVFDFGFDAVIGSEVGQQLLSSMTLERIGKLNARVAISIYTHDVQQKASP